MSRMSCVHFAQKYVCLNLQSLFGHPQAPNPGARFPYLYLPQPIGGLVLIGLGCTVSINAYYGTFARASDISKYLSSRPS